MSVQASFLLANGGSVYWPTGDVYPLTPSWGDLHTSQGLVPPTADEATITFTHIIPYGFDWYVTVRLTDLGTILNTTPYWYPNAAAAAAAAAVDDTVPTGYVRTESSITKPWGWSNSYSFEAEQVLDIDDVWTGDIQLTVDVALQDKIGFGEAWPFRVRIVLDTEDGGGQFPVYVMLGYLVVRP